MPRRTQAIIAFTSLAVLTAGCSSGASTTQNSASAAKSDVTITNCNEPRTYKAPVTRIHAHDGGIIAIVLAVGARDSISSMSSLSRDRAALTNHYGDAVTSLKDESSSMPSLENLIALKPQVVFAGWNYGFKEGGVNPEKLKASGIDSYLLTESCRQTAGQKERGVMPPWDALRADLMNIGTITGNKDKAEKVIEDLNKRLKALESAPQASTKPRVLLFDSGKDTVFTSGNKGGPQAIIEAAGAINVMGDVNDTWTKVSWERVAESKPDYIAFVEYGEQTFAEKVALLESNPATKDLPAVKEKRYLNLPYALWVSSPLNIDAAEQLRHKLEGQNLLPKSELPKPKFDDHVEKSPEKK